ncbi:CBR-PQN-85 protein, variant [Babesia caballi]|uniref:CBR-PQN-85 protein, variant n=1 Tax=Babesia caballi TaxID=5871 RepID=A0AAV4M0U0_BABCB|nr:CBR-PQN-85 protein, variant [Babesia caballi]
MAWSESSNTPHCAGRFYEDCESASENFLYRGRPQLPEESAAKTRILPKYTIFSELRRSFHCCFGARRSAESPPPLTDFDVFGGSLTAPAGVDVSKAFGSGRSQSSTAVCRKDNAGGRDRGKVCMAFQSKSHGLAQILWTIEPSKRNGNNEFTLSGARWVALAWVSRVANGETVTRSMLNDLLSDALRAKNSVEGLSKAAIKNFPGLQLAVGCPERRRSDPQEDISSFETVDHSMAIDSVVDALSDRSAPNMVSFAVLVKKNTCCHAVYLNNRGDTRDIVMLEVGVAGKHGNAKYTRIAAFRR